MKKSTPNRLEFAVYDPDGREAYRREDFIKDIMQSKGWIDGLRRVANWHWGDPIVDLESFRLMLLRGLLDEESNFGLKLFTLLWELSCLMHAPLTDEDRNPSWAEKWAHTSTGLKMMKEDQLR